MKIAPENFLFVILPVSIILAAGVDPAFAASGHAEGPLPGFFEFLWEKRIFWLNFLVYAFLLGYLLKKVFIKAWSGRRLAYQDAISSGQKLLRDSEVQLREAKELLSSLPSRIESLRVSVAREIDDDAQRIVREASEKASKIINQASQTAAAEKRAAISSYRERLVELAIEMARKRVTGLISDEVDSRLRSKVISGVSGLVN